VFCVCHWFPKWGARDVPWGCGKKINRIGLAPIKCTYIVFIGYIHIYKFISNYLQVYRLILGCMIIIFTTISVQKLWRPLICVTRSNLIVP
jgi:hypothetical protein